MTPFCNTSLQHSSPSLLSSTSLHNSAPTLPSAKLFFNTFLNQSHLSNASLQHSQTLLNKTLLQHFATTLFPNASPQHFSYMNSLHFPSVQYSSATLLYNVSTPLFSPNRLKQLIKHNPPPQHSSPTLLCNTSLQHSFSNTPQQHPSTTPQLYLASLCCRALQRQLEVVFGCVCSTAFCDV